MLHTSRWTIEVIKDQKQSTYNFRTRKEARAFAKEKRELGFAVFQSRKPKEEHDSVTHWREK